MTEKQQPRRHTTALAFQDKLYVPIPSREEIENWVKQQDAEGMLVIYYTDDDRGLFLEEYVELIQKAFDQL